MGRISISFFKCVAFRLKPKLYLLLTVFAIVVINAPMYLFKNSLRPTFTVVEPIKSSFLYIEKQTDPSPSQIKAIQFPFVF